MGTANYKWYSTWKPGTMVPIGIMTSQPPQDSPRTLHAFLYNWSRCLITTWRWPTYRAETCCCYNILLVIIEANLVVFDCKYNTPSSLLLYKTQWGWNTSEYCSIIHRWQNPLGLSCVTQHELCKCQWHCAQCALSDTGALSALGSRSAPRMSALLYKCYTQRFCYK